MRMKIKRIKIGLIAGIGLLLGVLTAYALKAEASKTVHGHAVKK